MLQWSDEKLGGKGHIDWKPFDHPQLGKVEIGGWDAQYAFRNPPPEFLEAEVEPLGRWAIWQAACSPRLDLLETRVEPVGDGLAKIRFAVHNTGWLPTNVTKIATERKLCRGVVGEISLAGQTLDGQGVDAPAWLKSGLVRQEAGQLVGWNHVTAGGFGWHMDGTDDRAVFEWLVAAGASYALVAKHERAGVVRATVQT